VNRDFDNLIALFIIGVVERAKPPWGTEFSRASKLGPKGGGDLPLHESIHQPIVRWN
jgi:hypothetical protein